MTQSTEFSAADLYEIDGLAWSERQVSLLKKIIAGERPNETPDWPNIVEEIEAMGPLGIAAMRKLADPGACAFAEMPGVARRPGDQKLDAETDTFLDDASRAFTPSMRQRMDLSELYATALRGVAHAADGTGEPRPLPRACPFLLNDLLARPLAPESLMLRLRA